MASVPFKVVDTSILVEGSVNGRPVLLIIDTGDSIGPTFNSADAQAIGLKSLGPLDVSGAGGAVQIQKTEADISLGGDTFSSEPGAIDPDLQGPSLLGLPFFLRQGGTLSFDFNSNLMSFGSAVPEECPPGIIGSLKQLLGLC